MIAERYEIFASEYAFEFEFVSQGKNGEVSKLIQFSETDQHGVYNLAFGDKDPVTGSFSDETVTNNGDSRKVLATVAATVLILTEMYPGIWVYATGLTPARTRLYRMGISNQLEDILVYFKVIGLRGECWEDFRKGVDYEAFAVRRK